jgi:hypothetical protein
VGYGNLVVDESGTFGWLIFPWHMDDWHRREDKMEGEETACLTVTAKTVSKFQLFTFICRTSFVYVHEHPDHRISSAPSVWGPQSAKYDHTQPIFS